MNNRRAAIANFLKIKPVFVLPFKVDNLNRGVLVNTCHSAFCTFAVFVISYPTFISRTFCYLPEDMVHWPSVIIIFSVIINNHSLRADYLNWFSIIRLSSTLRKCGNLPTGCYSVILVLTVLTIFQISLWGIRSNINGNRELNCEIWAFIIIYHNTLWKHILATKMLSTAGLSKCMGIKCCLMV